MSYNFELIGKNSSNVTSKVFVDTSNQLSVKDASVAQESTLSTMNGKITACNTGAVVVSSSALPTGAASESTLSTLNGKITACDTGSVTVASSALPTGAATESSLASVDGKITVCNTGAVVVSSSALPSGGATSALQTAGNADLATLAGAVSSGIVQVSAGTLSTTPTTLKNAVSVTDGSTETTNGLDAGAAKGVAIFGNCTDTTANIVIEVSSDDTNYYATNDSIFVDSNGDFFKNFVDLGARYIRAKYTNGSGSTATLTIIGSIKA